MRAGGIFAAVVVESYVIASVNKLLGINIPGVDHIRTGSNPALENTKL